MAWDTRTRSIKIRLTVEEMETVKNNCPADVPVAVWLRHLALETPQRPLRIPNNVVGVTDGDPSETPRKTERPLETPNDPVATSGTDRALLPLPSFRSDSSSSSKPEGEGSGRSPTESEPDPESTPGYWLAREPWKRLKDPQAKLSSLMDTYPKGVNHLAEARKVVQWWPGRKKQQSWLTEGGINRALIRWWREAMDAAPQLPGLAAAPAPPTRKPFDRLAKREVDQFTIMFRDSKYGLKYPEWTVQRWYREIYDGE